MINDYFFQILNVTNDLKKYMYPPFFTLRDRGSLPLWINELKTRFKCWKCRYLMKWLHYLNEGWRMWRFSFYSGWYSAYVPRLIQFGETTFYVELYVYVSFWLLDKYFRKRIFLVVWAVEKYYWGEIVAICLIGFSWKCSRAMIFFLMLYEKVQFVWNTGFEFEGNVQWNMRALNMNKTS